MVGHRARRDGGRPRQERRGARGAREGRHARRRQDRHADRGQAAARHHRGPCRRTTRASCCASPASLERGSEHPLAARHRRGGARARARARGGGRTSALAGAGACRAGSTAARVALGNAQLLGTLGIELGDCSARGPMRCAAEGQTVVFVAVDGRSGGARSPSPTRSRPRPRRRSGRSTTTGIRIVMLTGDSRATARGGGADSSGSIEVEAEVLAATRRSPIVKRLQAEGRIVAMAGDGDQRRAGAGAGRRGHRDGHRHRRRDGERRTSRW